MVERLQKVLARAGVASRRAAEELIREGRVTVDGRVVTEMGVRVDPGRQHIACDGRPLDLKTSRIYLLLNKPRGYVTTMQDPQGRPIAASLLTGITDRVFPVGRLDMDTEGALLFTNDGDLAHRIQHPSHGVEKTYEARIAGHPGRRQLARLEKGIMLEGKRTWPARIRIIERRRRNTLVSVTIHEGRKHQVRKMFAAIGHPVITLKRIAYGGLELGNLPSGRYRWLKSVDLQSIFS